MLNTSHNERYINLREMFEMAGFKNLLGDILFEEFEDLCKTVLDSLKESDINKFDENMDDETNKLYDYWLEIGGKELARKWVNDNGGTIIIVRKDEFRQYLIAAFIGWLEGH
jgi:phosphopantothenoylcysteine synthetase/decarboxylase